MQDPDRYTGFNFQSTSPMVAYYSRIKKGETRPLYILSNEAYYYIIL